MANKNILKKRLTALNDAAADIFNTFCFHSNPVDPDALSDVMSSSS